MSDEVYFRRAAEARHVPRTTGNRHAAKRERRTRPAFCTLVDFINRNPRLSWSPLVSTNAELAEARALCAAAMDERKRLSIPVQYWRVDVPRLAEQVEVEIDARICGNRYEGP